MSSQSIQSSNASPGSTFASPDGPWVLYLKHLSKKDRPKAEELLGRYATAFWNVEASPFTYADLPFAQVLDIASDNAVKTWSTITFKELFDQRKQIAEVNRFITSLHMCEPDVHSRLLILNSESFEKEYEDGINGLRDPFEAKAYYRIWQDLLVAQILAIEFDMTFSEVYTKLMEQDKFHFKTQDMPFRALDHTYKDMRFYGRMPHEQTIRAYTLRPRSINARAIEHSE